MWSEGEEGGGRGVEGRSEAWTVFETEGAEEVGGKAEEEGQLGRRCNHTTGRDGEEGGEKSCYCAVHSPGEWHFWPGLNFFPLSAFTSTPPPVLCKHQHTWSQFVSQERLQFEPLLSSLEGKAKVNLWCRSRDTKTLLRLESIEMDTLGV